MAVRSIVCSMQYWHKLDADVDLFVEEKIVKNFKALAQVLYDGRLNRGKTSSKDSGGGASPRS